MLVSPNALGARRGRGSSRRIPSFVSLIAAGDIAAPLALTRAQTPSGAKATAEVVTANAWQLFDADQPRKQSGRLLIEGSRTNLMGNPLLEGSAAPSTFPTNSTQSVNANHTLTVLGTGTANGLPYVDFQLVSTGAGTSTLSLDLTMDVSGAPAGTFTQSVFCRIIGGSTTNFSVFGFRRRISSTTVDVGATISMLGASTTALQRFEASAATLADSSNVQYQVIVTSSGAGTLQFRLACPQYALASFAGTVILNPAGNTSGVPTRGPDLVSCALSSLGIVNGACTVLFRGRLLQSAMPALAVLLQMDLGGSPSDRWYVDNPTSGGIRLNGSGSVSAATIGTPTANTDFSLGFTCDGAGRAAASFNGGTAVEITGGPVAAFDTLRIGSHWSGAANLRMEVGSLQAKRAAVSNADLATLTGAFT